MIKRPVRYLPQEKSIEDADHVVVCFPFQKVGLPDVYFHPIGYHLAQCINLYVEPQETQAEAVKSDPGEVVEEKKKRGRPKKL